MPNPQQREGRQPGQAGQDGHVERQPVPGHTENTPVGPDMPQTPGGGAIEDAAPAAEPATKPGTPPGTPPGTQSERDRLRGSS